MSPDRFKPVRAGIIGVWDYAEQEFRFADGRLVLRGPNGSGKTKALEVLVPFVLDGSIDARRLDPFSGQERTMRSNLLYGDQKIGNGYCWLELARGEEHVTIGVGMRAQEQSPSVKTWFFVADAVVGDTMELLADRAPRTYRELREHLGDAHVFERREDHRNAVDRRLFGLGHERYRAMLELILTLRRPQLAKDLDPEILSDVLSDGLRTIDREMLQTSAQAFDNLEAAQRELSELERADRAVAGLVKHWRTYLRARASKRVQDVSLMAERLRSTMEKLAAADRMIRDFTLESEAGRQLASEHASEVDRQTTKMDALRASEAYQNRGQLDDARSAVQDAGDTVERAELALGRVESAWQGSALAREGAEQRRDQAAGKARATQTTLLAHLRLAGQVFGDVLEIDTLRAWIVARSASIAAVLAEVESCEEAQKRLDRAEEELQRALAEAENAAEELHYAREVLADLLQRVEEALGTWHEELPAEFGEALPLDALIALIPDFGAAGDLVVTASAAWADLRDGSIARSATLATMAQELGEEIEACTRSIEEIRHERQDAPPTPPTRGADRAERPGAPLWRLVRFRDEVSEADQARLEGALFAAGLLDAWVDPVGVAPLLDRDDTELRPTGMAAGPTLADVLLPETDGAVSVEHLAAILESVSLQGSSVCVGLDGRFRLGLLRGAHRPDQPRYIGATARARHRQVRISRLELEREAWTAEREAVVAEEAACRLLLLALESAVAGLPDPDPVRQARRRVEQAEGKHDQAERTRTQAAVVRAGAARERIEAERNLRRVAAQHGIDPTPEDVRALQGHLENARDALTEHRAAQERLTDCDDEVRRAEEQHEAAGEAAAAATRDRDEAKRVFQAKKTRLDQLGMSLGAAVEEVVADLSRAEEARALAEEKLEEASQAMRSAEKNVAIHEGVRRTHSEELPNKEEDLAHAEAALAPFRNSSMQAVLEVADTDAAFAERLAMAVAGASFSDDQLKSTETRLGKHLERIDEELGTRFHSVRSTEDGIVGIKVADELGEHGLERFAARLQQRVQIARQLFDEQERKLFEDHLLGTLCSQLRERIEETRQLVRTMDEAMRKRILASRKSLSISWRPLPDGDPARRELLGLLQFDPKFLNTERLTRVRALLSEEVQTARRDRPDRSYLEILEEALDYRRWHRFELTLLDPTGDSRRLSRAVHSRLSGGEKAATLHVPLFAAAHAHFAAGYPHCPRLVALDEAFAGIDDTGVPELLRLAAAFDLDWFLTGFDLWVTEPFLPGVMHYDLAHDPVSRAVNAWPVLWNGHETIEGDELEP